MTAGRSGIVRGVLRGLACLAVFWAEGASAQFYDVTRLDPVGSDDASEAAVLLDNGLAGGTTWGETNAAPRAVFWPTPSAPVLLPLPRDQEVSKGEVLGGCLVEKTHLNRHGVAFCGVTLRGADSIGIVWQAEQRTQAAGDGLVFTPRLYRDLSSVAAVRSPQQDRILGAPLVVLGSSFKQPEMAVLHNEAARTTNKLFQGTPTDLDITRVLTASGYRHTNIPVGTVRFQSSLLTPFRYGKALAFYDDTDIELPGKLAAAMSVIHQARTPEFAGAVNQGNPGTAVLWTGRVGRIRSEALGNLNAKFTLALDNNLAQDVVGVAQEVRAPRDRAAFLWTPRGGFRNINDFINPDADIHLLEARSVNASGDIAGLALFNGKPRGFILKRKAANLTINKTLANGATEAGVGDVVQFVITWVYTGLEPTTGLVITDNVPPGLDQVSPITPGGRFVSGTRQVVFNVPGTIMPNQAGSVIFSARVTASARGAFTNLTYTAGSARSLNATGTPLVVRVRPPPPILPSPLVVLKSAVPTPSVNAGAELIYQIFVFNSSGTPVTGITLHDEIPAGTTLVPPPSAGSSVAGNRISWNIGTLNGGTAASASFTVRVAAQNGEVCNNSCFVTAPGFTDAHAPDVCTAVVRTNSPLIVTKTASPNPVESGGQVVFHLTAINPNPEPLNAVIIRDPVPQGTSLSGSPGNGGTFADGVIIWTRPTLEAGSAHTVTFTARVTNATGQICNTGYTATASGIPSTIGTPVCVDIIQRQPTNRLLLIKTAQPNTPVHTGGLISYILTAINPNDTPVSNVRITDPVPSGSTLNGQPGNDGTVEDGLITWTQPALAAGAALTVTFTVRVDSASGFICNTGHTVRADGLPATAGTPLCTTVISELAQPVVTFPRACMTVATGIPTFAEAVVTDPSNIALVEFRVDGVLIGSDTTAPYQVDYSSGGPGQRCIIARSVAHDGRIRDSASVCMNVIPRFTEIPRYTISFVTNNNTDLQAKLNDCGEFTIRPRQQEALTQYYATDGSRQLLSDTEAGVSRPIFVFGNRLNNRGQWLADMGGTPRRNVFWDPSTGQIVTDFPPLPGSTSSEVFDMNNRGLVVGSSSPGLTGTLWQAGVPARILPGRVLEGESVNDSGVIVVAEGRLVQNGTVIETAPRLSFFEDINERSSSAGADFGSSPVQRVIWHRPGIFEVITPPTATNRCIADAINNHNMVVGTMDEISGAGTVSSLTQRGFLYLNGRVTDLNTIVNAMPFGLKIERASDINDAGQIIATGFQFGVGGVTLVLTPVP